MTPPDASDRDYRELFRRAGRLTAALREFETLSLAVSHDFRIPLRAIEKAVHALGDARGGDDPELRGEMRAMRGALGQIDRMMADLDEFCRSGVCQITLELVDMEALVRDAWTSLGRKEGISFGVGRLPAARADRGMMGIVWRHLLETAVGRCAGRHNARIHVNGGDSAAFAVYSVHDNGAELELDFPGKLFYSFEQIQKQSTHPGNGVALAIVQRLVTRHRGNVWVDSSPEKGNVFQFSIGEAQADASLPS